MRGTPFMGGFKVDAGGIPPPPPPHTHTHTFCRDRAPDFVWAPQAKKKLHQIVRIDFEIFFSPLMRGQSLQVPSSVSPSIWEAPSFFRFLDVPLPFKHKQGLQKENFRGTKLTGDGVRATFFNFAPGRQV